jgi:hypothetical protein
MPQETHGIADGRMGHGGTLMVLGGPTQEEITDALEIG